MKKFHFCTVSSKNLSKAELIKKIDMHVGSNKIYLPHVDFAYFTWAHLKLS